MQHTSDSAPPSPIPAAGLATGTQLKSVSLKKLSMKTLQTKKGKGIDAVAEKLAFLRQQGDTPTRSDEVMVVERDFASTSDNRSPRVQRDASDSRLLLNEATGDVDVHSAGEEIASDDDLDLTPPISQNGNSKKEKLQVDGVDIDLTAVDKPSLKVTSAAVCSEEGLLQDKGRVAIASGQTRSMKQRGLSLKKGRKRLSDSMAMEVNSFDVQSPVAKRPKITGTDPTIALTKTPCTGSTSEGEKLVASTVDVDKHATSKPDIKLALVSLKDIRKSQDISKIGNVNKSEKFISSSAEPAASTEDDKLCKEGADIGTMEVDMERDGTTSLASVENQQEAKQSDSMSATVSKESAMMSTFTKSSRDGGSGVGYTVRRKTSGWPLVKIRASEIPRVPSLQAPPNVLHSKHTQILIQCFNEYIAKLAVAQCKVLWRIKWGQPVLSVNKVVTSTLSAGRRTKRSRSTVIPYSQYALDLKDTCMSPSSKRQSSSPVAAVSKRSPSKTSDFDLGDVLISSDPDSDFQPPKSVEKQNTHQQKYGRSAGRKRLHFNSGTTSGPGTTPSKSADGSGGRLSLRKKSAGQRERLDKSESESPCVQIEREESPDILPSCQLTRKTELDFAAVTASSNSSPPRSSCGTPLGSAGPQFQDDDIAMLDLTTPSPPPGGQGGGALAVVGEEHEFENATISNTVSHSHIGHDPDNSSNKQGPPHTHLRHTGSTLNSHPQTTTGSTLHSSTGYHMDDSTNEQGDNPHKSATAKTSCSRVGLDTDDSADEQGVPPRTITSAETHYSRIGLDTENSSSDEHVSRSTSRAGAWLDARKPPPPQPKAKGPTKRTNVGSKPDTQSKKTKTAATAGGRGRGAKGNRTTKRPASAALRIKALIQKADSDSGHSSQEDERVATRSSMGVTPRSKPAQKSRNVGHQSLDSSDSDMSNVEFEDRGGGGYGQRTSPVTIHVPAAVSKASPRSGSQTCER